MNKIIRRIPRRIKLYCQRAKRGFADEIARIYGAWIISLQA
jgi:hypothetical protein